MLGCQQIKGLVETQAHPSAASAHEGRNVSGSLGRSLCVENVASRLLVQSCAGWLCSFWCPDPPRCMTPEPRRETGVLLGEGSCQGASSGCVFWGVCGVCESALKIITLQCTGLQRPVMQIKGTQYRTLIFRPIC